MKNIKMKRIDQKNAKTKIFYQKIFLLTIIFTTWSIIFNSNYLNFNTDISKGLLNWTQIASNLKSIKDNSTIRPFKKVTNRWEVKDYKWKKNTNWKDLEKSFKTPFPSRISQIIKKYRYLDIRDIRNHIANPSERKKVIFYKRLITAIWTSEKYKDSSRWIPDSWSHAGVDFVSSIWTPVYSISDWIIIKKDSCSNNNCWAFWNYIIIATEFKWEIIATFYAHLNKIKGNIKEWSIIKKSQQIWTVGKTWNSTAPHLHLQINKLWKTEKIKNLNVAKKLFDKWFQNKKVVKQKTYNPITFIEKHYLTTDDSFKNKLQENDKEEKTELTHSSPKEKDLQIQKININKINNKLTLWDTIKAEIITTWKNWVITLTTNNNVLEPSKDIIKRNWKSKHNIEIKAAKNWQWEIIFNDWENKINKFFKVYKEERRIYWFKIQWPDKIYKTQYQEFIVYPIDKFWTKIEKSLEGKMKLYLKNKESQKKRFLKEIQIEKNKSTIDFEIKAPEIKDYQLIVKFEWKNNSMKAVKSLKSDIFLDYSKNDKYWKSIKYLNENWIVKGHNWLLMPNQAITRNEIITILIRKRYWNNPGKFSKQMEKYIKENWKFFKDIDGKKRYDPYLFIAYKDEILKWANWKALPHKIATKAELITIYGRFFDVSKYEIFTNWLDVKEEDRYKIYADAAKNYNLFPFENTKYFQADKKVDRVKAFESLYRYIHHTPDKEIAQQTNKDSNNKNTNEKANDKELESIIKTLMEEEE